VPESAAVQNVTLSIHTAFAEPCILSFPLVISKRPHGDKQKAHSIFSYNCSLLQTPLWFPIGYPKALMKESCASCHNKY
jgi:hypothetical protein